MATRKIENLVFVFCMICWIQGNYAFHFENLPIFLVVTMKIFSRKILFFILFFFFLYFFLQNIHRGYMLEPPRQGGSNEYPQSMFISKNKKNRYTPPYPSYAI